MNMWILSTCDLCGDSCREIDLTDINESESVCEDCLEIHKQELQAAFEELYSEIEVADPVGYGECMIEEGDLI